MKRDAGKEKFWRKTMVEAQGSGQSVREFCRQRGIKENQLYAWRRELRTRDAEAGDVERGEMGPHIIRDPAEILGDDSGAGGGGQDGPQAEIGVL